VLQSQEAKEKKRDPQDQDVHVEIRGDHNVVHVDLEEEEHQEQLDEAEIDQAKE